MNPFDPDFSDLSDEQLAEIDSLCTDYEAKRTQGIEVAVEEVLRRASAAIHSPLRLELIQIELEILDAWDQLSSPDEMLEHFPELEAFIRQRWQALKARWSTQNVEQPTCDTQSILTSSGSTYDDGQTIKRSEQLAEVLSVAGDQLHRFRIIRNLAQGGIGTVFVAYDRDLQREVAIKELKRKFANVRAVVQRFDAEATVTGNLEHPNIVPIYATGRRSDGRPYYAMRLIRGRSMQVVVSELHQKHSHSLDFRNQPVARDLLFRFVTVCRAIGFAHTRGVLHRDLKASNIMVGDFGETLVVDWGLARYLHARDHTDQASTQQAVTDQLGRQATLHGTIVGTPGFMSPEQAMGRTDEITVACDIYSLGATLFQILTNSVPLTNSVLTGTVEKFVTAPAPLKAICQKAMAVEPRARYASAELLAADLEAWLFDEPVSVLPDTRVQKVKRWAKKHPAIVGSGLASLLIAIVAMGVTLSILSEKNESLRISNLREQAAAHEASQSEAAAKAHGEEAVRQRQRVLGILNTFLMDVERGLANVPGSAAVQRNVLTTVLNKLGEISNEFADDRVSQSNAMALVDLGDLFSRVGTKDIRLDLPRSSKVTLSPLEAAGEMYAEAMEIAERSQVDEAVDQRRIIALIKQKQADVLRQTARTPEALKLISESLTIRKELLADSPASVQAALDVVSAIDYRGQIYLQDGDYPGARVAFVETQSMLNRLSQDSPEDTEIKRRLGIALSRLADIAVHDGDIDLATQLYNQDLAISKELYESSPNSISTKRDLCIALDRIGNISATRGRLQDAMVSYVESRRLREELHEAEPTDMKLSLELIVSYMKCGDARMLLKEVDEAQADYGKVLNLSDDLAKIDPQNTKVRRFQSMSAEVLADVALEQKQYDAALGFAKKSLTISRELVAKDPTNGEMQRDLFICYAKVAKVLLGQKAYEECLAQLDLALNIAQSCYQRHPESLQSIGDYSFILMKRAEAYLETGNAASASHDLGIVIPLLESIPESNRQDAKTRRRLANAITMLGRTLAEQAQTAKARTAFERSREMTVAMIEEGVRVEQMQLDLEEIDSLIASTNEQ